ncbi:hypothetical protein Tco_1038946 [Tanacetum coccineum]
MDNGSWVNGFWCWGWDHVRVIWGRAHKDYDELLEMLQNDVVSNNCRDQWRWALDDDDKFKVKELTRLIEKILHVKSGGQETLWNKLVPKSLVTCDLAMSVWEKVFNWWNLGTVNAFYIDEFFSSYRNVTVPVSISTLWQAVIWSTGY